MKNLYKNNRKCLMAGMASLLLAMIMFVSCFYLDSISYESTLQAGEETTFTVDMHIESAENRDDERLIFSLLAPKSWNASAYTTVTYTDTYDEGIVKTMSLVPVEDSPKNQQGMTWDAALKSKYGVGPNVLDDMEWLTFQSSESYDIKNGDNQSATIKIVTRVGEENMRVKLGFFINMSGDGLGSDIRYYKVEYTECIEVTGGDESLYIDFCESHFNLVQPSNATKDDIMTFKFQGDIGENALDAASEIYLCAKAFTTAGREYAVTERTAKTCMINEQGRTYSLTFWAADYFGIPENEEILRVEYYFTNADGTLSVMETTGDETSPAWFLSTFNCK